MAIGTVVTRGYGSGATIGLVVMRGYGAGAVIPPVVVPSTTVTGGGGGKRRRRTWKTTQEVLEELSRERDFIYVPAEYAPEPYSIAAEVRGPKIDHALQANIFVAEVRKQMILKRKRKMRLAATMMLLDS